MIQEITRFIDHLEADSTSIFSENIELKDGLYFLLEYEGDKLTINDEKTLLVNKKTEKGALYQKFLSLYSNSEMITSKSLNSIEKIFIDVGSPFAISISGKGIKPDNTKGEDFEGRKQKQISAMKAYNKAVDSYLDWDKENDKELVEMRSIFKSFVEDDLQMILYDQNGKLQQNEATKNWEYSYIFNGESIGVKDTFMFYFFMEKPTVDDYSTFHNKYLSQKVFLNDLKGNEIYGISNDLNVGNVDKKPFTRHKTAPFDINYRVDGESARKLYKFFRLQQKNKVLPNPMPLFIDKDELTQDAISFYKEDAKRGHQEIIELLLKEKNADLSNYYLIYFHNGYKGSRIVDYDFVSKFRYFTEDMPTISPVFNVRLKNNELIFRRFSVENVFYFQKSILNVLFNKQLLQETKNGLWIKYFDDLDEKPDYGATATIVNLFYRYRRALYDYVYKSRDETISFLVFDEICRKSILDDIKNTDDKSIRIKEKLNIWFSLYNYFNHNIKLDNMVNKTKELLLHTREIAEQKEMHIESNEEFAFASGQLIRTILNKSESGERSHALLEPFLQKTQDDKFKLAIARAFENYKHAFKFYKSEEKRYSFDKIMSEVMGFETKENLKNLLPIILAGYFSDSIFSNNSNDK